MSKTNKFSLSFLTVVLLLGLGFSVLAQEPTANDEPAPVLISAEPTATNESADEELALDEDVSAQDLDMEEPGLLPDSRFYFFKNWVRTIRSAFAFNSLKKAELKAKYASERLLEARALALQEKSQEVLEKTAEKYQEELENLKEAVDKIKETALTSDKVGKFLDKFTEQQFLHQKILDKLESQVPANAMEKIVEVRESHLEKFGEVMQKLEDKTQIKARLENALQVMEGSQFKEVKEMEMLKRVEEKLPEVWQEKVQELRQEKLEQFQEKLESFSEKNQERLENYLEKMKAQGERKLEIIEDIKGVTNQAVLRNRIEGASTQILQRVKERIEEQTGINCPEDNMINPFACSGRVIIEKDSQGCPVPSCAQLGEGSAGVILPAPTPSSGFDSGSGQGPQAQAEIIEIPLNIKIEVEAEPIKKQGADSLSQ